MVLPDSSFDSELDPELELELISSLVRVSDEDYVPVLRSTSFGEMVYLIFLRFIISTLELPERLDWPVYRIDEADLCLIKPPSGILARDSIFLTFRGLYTDSLVSEAFSVSSFNTLLESVASLSFIMADG